MYVLKVLNTTSVQFNRESVSKPPGPWWNYVRLVETRDHGFTWNL